MIFAMYVASIIKHYGEFHLNRLSTENLLEERKRAGMEKCFVDLLKELSFSCEKHLSESN